MIYDMDFFQSIENRGMVNLNENHSIYIQDCETIEDDFGVVEYVTNVIVYITQDGKTEDYPCKLMQYTVTPRESNYHTFVKTYEKICRYLDIEPVNWR